MKTSKQEFLKISGYAPIKQKQKYLRNNGIDNIEKMEFIGSLERILPDNNIVFNVVYFYDKEKQEFNEVNIFKDKNEYLEAILHTNDDRDNFNFEKSDYYIFKLEMNHEQTELNEFPIAIKQGIKIRSIKNDINMKKQYVKIFMEKFDILSKEEETVINDKLMIISKKEEELQGHEKKIEIQEDTLKQKSKKLRKYIEMDRMGLFEEKYKKDNQNEDCFSEKYDSISEYASHIRAYLALKDNLFYEKEIIIATYLGVLSNQIIVFNGKPGSGKSSLARSFAKAVGGKFYNVSVQSNWLDKNDLLGYYNPLKDRYESTEFLDQLISFCWQAECFTDKKFFICLDEMNLSHVEYYFADFLVHLQNDRKIELYPERIFHERKESLEDRYTEDIHLKFDDFINTHKLKQCSEADVKIFFEDNNGLNRRNIRKIIKKLNNLIKYPPVLTIPTNVHFMATINKDETTKDLSPKVIDRSYFIKLESANEVSLNNKKLIMNQINKELEKHEHYLKPLSNMRTDWNMNLEAADTLFELLTETKESNVSISNRLNVSVSNRLREVVRKFSVDENFVLDNNKNEHKAINVKDLILAALILPKIYIDKNEDEWEEQNKALEGFFDNNNFSFSSSVYEQMEGPNDISYWR